jgi:hypothetical protein
MICRDLEGFIGLIAMDRITMVMRTGLPPFWRTCHGKA